MGAMPRWGAKHRSENDQQFERAQPMTRGRQKHRGRNSNMNQKFPDTIAEGSEDALQAEIAQQANLPIESAGRLLTMAASRCKLHSIGGQTEPSAMDAISREWERRPRRSSCSSWSCAW